jgi:exonuclease 3'-5' domain-containing protein 2
VEKNNILHVGSKNLNLENWKVYHPSGRHMFTCGEKKAQWYLERDLAKLIGKKKIRFTFIPKGNGFEDNEEFGRSIRIARCVVTGRENGLQRHHIVPYCYRTFFPEAFKSKNHHDVVLINHEIHSIYERKANEYKNVIAKIYNVKTIGELNVEYTMKLRETGKYNSILLNAIHSIFKSYKKIPENVKLEKLRFISKETNIPYNIIESLNYIQLYKLYLLLRKHYINEINTFKRENRTLYDHGYHVAQKLDTEEKIEEFVKLWRNHFIDTMHPLYMPNGWSVDFRIKTKI